MGDRPAVRLFAELIDALHDESDALVADDPARLAAAASRKDHILRLLAPQTNALRVMRHSGADERERLAREAAQLGQVADLTRFSRAPETNPASRVEQAVPPVVQATMPLNGSAADHSKIASTVTPAAIRARTKARAQRD